jgi:hypothetical protein
MGRKPAACGSSVSDPYFSSLGNTDHLDAGSIRHPKGIPQLWIKGVGVEKLTHQKMAKKTLR